MPVRKKFQPIMDEIKLRNFRCFRDEQNVRLAPLTLLVGENSTGKTSFMAMIRALWDVAFGDPIPNFKEEPYDLGSFDDIAHYRGRRGGRAESFSAEFCLEAGKGKTKRRSTAQSRQYRFSVTFGRSGTEAIPVQRCLQKEETWFESNIIGNARREFRVGTDRGRWKLQSAREPESWAAGQDAVRALAWDILHFRVLVKIGDDGKSQCNPIDESPEIGEDDIKALDELMRSPFNLPVTPSNEERPYAGAPVRSRPRRTYDPARTLSDPQGDNVPMLLANVFFQSKREWEALRGALEDFGHTSGLFDEIAIKQLGKRESEPFQVHVRKYSGKLKGPSRNLIDVGYGVSQVLPLVTELLRRDAPGIFLIQQPEVHLHPSAQAALGSLLCKIAGRNGRRLIIETHSDHILDRVRMDIRDGVSDLNPEDVSILFFEREDLAVKIHSLEIDKQGNILGAPETYRRFFMGESRRSLGI